MLANKTTSDFKNGITEHRANKNFVARKIFDLLIIVLILFIPSIFLAIQVDYRKSESGDITDTLPLGPGLIGPACFGHKKFFKK